MKQELYYFYRLYSFKTILSYISTNSRDPKHQNLHRVCVVQQIKKMARKL